MTPFELWLAGEGPEPAVVAGLPRNTRNTDQPWTYQHHAMVGAYYRTLAERSEALEAAEEQRAALERALSFNIEELRAVIAGLKRVRRGDERCGAWLDLPMRDLEALCEP